ncbi:MAG: copper resistance protein CopC, partial [Candidatus Dormibacteraeota bacterium]|nr:copper resistance protein CopC [Candidatus Dormibacteraeota bacterium]
MVAALGAGLASVLVPVVALAHASLVTSSPQAGQHLGTAPGAVQLVFSEPVNTRLSSVLVATPDGRSYRGTIDRQGTARVPLATDEVGVYSVRWSTVSAVDGHRLQGQFTFGVGVAAGGGAPAGGGGEASPGSVALAA